MTDFDDEDIARLRMALARISRQVDRQVSTGGLSRTQLSVLSSVARRGPLGATELAEIEGVNPTMLSRILAKLEEAGLVARAAAVEDRRAIRVAITPKGEEFSQRLRTERSALLADRLERIAPGQVKRIRAALPALEALAEEMSRQLVQA